MPTINKKESQLTSFVPLCITEGAMALQVRQGTFVILIEGNEFVIGSYRFETVHLPDLTHAAIKRPSARSHCVWVCVNDSVH